MRVEGLSELVKQWIINSNANIIALFASLFAFFALLGSSFGYRRREVYA